MPSICNIKEEGNHNLSFKGKYKFSFDAKKIKESIPQINIYDKLNKVKNCETTYQVSWKDIYEKCVNIAAKDDITDSMILIDYLNDKRDMVDLTLEFWGEALKLNNKDV